MLRYPYVCRRSAPLPHPDEETNHHHQIRQTTPSKYNYILLSINIVLNNEVIINQKFTAQNPREIKRTRWRDTISDNDDTMNTATAERLRQRLDGRMETYLFLKNDGGSIHNHNRHSIVTAINPALITPIVG